MLQALRRLTLWFALAGAVVAMGVGLMTTVSVVGRAVFKAPIPGDVELTQMGIALAISLSLPWCQLHGGNIIVDFFTQKMAERKLRLLDAAGALCLVAMYGVLAWRTGAGALAVRQAQETTMIIGLPMWWAYASLAPGLALAGVLAAAQAWLHGSGQAIELMHGARR
ncbi:MAG: TRAP transporter small permease [Burkholderiales bacterium]|nr:TRAP transporter small permease [Burkholderiales bacterium]